MDLTNGQACRILANAQNRENLEINNKSRTKRNGKKTSFEFKIFVISQINNGQISTNFASKKYDISRSTMDYWRKKLSNYTSKSKAMSKELEIKKLKEKLQELEWIKDFQQDVIVEFEKVTGKELSKELLPKHLANEIQKRKNKLK
ncbi:helix-turn-helix, Psq domain [Soonwooa buanensis]|uniref:Helix-turn-helix, Psq domain n=1 Tax=Soonwooa buanensis TaxID=619805 RepID=A0A1T5CY51_9FLAO|nr:helix-turn-helix domain-containing protein [Soonwooa buanensis]SKB64329.1 helix-turn-helix, Psq domain [Soonwooa buanensis]